MCRHVEIDVWTDSIDRLPPDSAIRRRCRGPAWGVEMYRILRRSLMTLNHHIDMAGPFAANLRLFEATGVGTLLVTDWKENLPALFEPGREVIAYRTNDECVEPVCHFLAHDAETSPHGTGGTTPHAEGPYLQRPDARTRGHRCAGLLGQVLAMRYFCTYCDRRYLGRTLALYRSLRRHAGRLNSGCCVWTMSLERSCRGWTLRI